MSKTVKYLVLVIVSAFLGFVGAWWLFNSTTNDIPLARHSRSPSIQVHSITTPGNSAPTPLTQQTFDFSSIEQEKSIFNQLYIAWQLAATADIPQLKVLIDQCMDHDDPLYTENIAAVFMERFIAIDPRAAMDYVIHNPRLDQTFFQTDVITSWVRYDPRAAIDYFKDLSNQEIKIATGARLLDDPTVRQAGLLEEVKQAIGPYADRIADQIRMRKSDPADLFEQAMQTKGNDRIAKLNSAVGRWMMRDPQAALDRIMTLSSPSERNNMIQLAISVYSQQDPEAALKWLQERRPSDTGLQRQVLSTFARQDIDKALPMVEDFVRRTGATHIWDNIVRSWASKDPDAAISYVENMPGNDKTDLYRGLAYAYVSSHPSEGLRWVAQLGPAYNSVKTSALGQIDHQNITTAEQLLRQSSDDVARSALIRGISRYKSMDDPAAALVWLTRYRRDPGYTSAYQMVMQQYGQVNPAEAARSLDASIDGKAMSGAAATIAYAWYRKDPNAAVDWATSLPPSDKKDGAVAALARSAGNDDLDRAATLLDSLPAHTRRDIATAIGFSWANRHPAQVEEAISKLNLPIAVATQLRRAAGEGR